MPQLDSGNSNARRGPGMAISTYAANRSQSALPAFENTFVQNLEQAWCPDGHRNDWEMQVPNGVYRVNMSFAMPSYTGTGPVNDANTPTVSPWSGFRTQGCVVEDTEITSSTFIVRCSDQLHRHFLQTSPPLLPHLTFLHTVSRISSCADDDTCMRAAQQLPSTDDVYTTTRTVEVTDGRLTMSAIGGDGGDIDYLTMCQLVNAITIERVASTTFPASWVPPSDARGAWWQQDTNNVPIGLVTVTPTPGRTNRFRNTDCRYRMMLEGNTCQGSRGNNRESNPLGNFTNANQVRSVPLIQLRSHS
jgi:hypothetical protein